MHCIKNMKIMDIKLDFRPASKEVYTITHSSNDRIEGEMWLGKGSAGPPLHIHPGQEENLELLKGKLQVYRNGKWEIIESGVKWRIPANEIHTFKGLSDSEALVKFSVSPAGEFYDFLNDTYHLIQSGKLKSYDSLSGLVYSSMLVSKYKNTFRASQFHMRLIMGIATIIGRLTGRKI